MTAPSLIPLSLLARLASLNADERSVVVEVMRHALERLELGRERYGELHLDIDTRDWHREAEDEVGDLAAYTAMARVLRARGK